jgi:hypothetical protein
MGFNVEMHLGNFSSSDIVRLCGTKKVRDTYIQEKNTERKLGRSLNKDFYSRDTSWGHLIEYWVLQKKLGTEYALTSLDTLRHPTVNCWVGSPDALKHLIGVETVCDVKALQLKAFCEMVDAFEKGGIQEVRNETDAGEKFYKQIVSNGCITGVNHGELILACPYKSELDEIRHIVNNDDNLPNPERFKWIAFAHDDELAYLPDGGHYKNLNFFQFPLPADDRMKLHDIVVEASNQLIPFKTKTLEPVCQN